MYMDNLTTNRSTKFLTGFLLGVIILSLALVAWLRFYQKSNSAKPSSNLPTVNQVSNSSNPGKIFGPKVTEKTAVLSADKIIELTNVYRAKENIAPLTKNETLTKAAQAKVDDMFAKQYFEHISPSGVTPAQLVLKTGYNYKTTGENLALGGFKNEQELVDAWYASLGHRENMLNPEFVEIGVASSQNDFEGNQTWLSVQEFGKLAPNCTKPDEELAASITQNKAEYKTLSTQLDEVSSAGQKLNTEANQQITQGNTIYSETHSKTKAQPYWDEGSRLQAEAKAKYNEVQTLDAKIREIYTQIDTMLKKYNQQVNVYNECIKN